MREAIKATLWQSKKANDLAKCTHQAKYVMVALCSYFLFQLSYAVRFCLSAVVSCGYILCPSFHWFPTRERSLYKYIKSTRNDKLGFVGRDDIFFSRQARKSFAIIRLEIILETTYWHESLIHRTDEEYLMTLCVREKRSWKQNRHENKKFRIKFAWIKLDMHIINISKFMILTWR